MAITLRTTDNTAVMVAQNELKKLYRVLEHKVNERLEACYTEEEDGHKIFYEPPDLKWYMQELRKAAETISKIEAKREETITKGKIDIMKMMAAQAKLSRKDREKIRREYIEVDANEPD